MICDMSISDIQEYFKATARENLTVISILEQQTCKSNHINVTIGNK